MSSFPVARIVSGSRLYGTSTPESDTDIKTVMMPDARDILLQSAGLIRQEIGEFDTETLPLHRFLHLLLEGQTIAVEIAFAPPSAHTIPPHPVFKRVQAERHRIISKDISRMISYAGTQAKKFAIRGTHLDAAERALAYVEGAIRLHGSNARAAVLENTWKQEAESSRLFAIAERVQPNGRSIPHLQVCETLAPFGASLDTAKTTFSKLVKEYGARSRMAMTNEGGIDWKGMAHAVRILEQMHELLTAGVMTFPRPNAADLLAIRRGEHPYQEIADRIETLFDVVPALLENSTLPEKGDAELVDDIVTEAYGEVVALHVARRREVMPETV